MKAHDMASRLPQRRDVSALIGMMAVLEGEVWGVADPDDDEIPDWALRMARRLSMDGLLAADAGQRDLRQALKDLNHRLRYVLGEYDEPPVPRPLPQ